MTKPPGKADRKPLHWVGSSNEEICQMPLDVRVDFGRRLNLAQRGRLPPSTKPWQGLGPGVFEMVRSFDGDAYRAVYAAKFEKALYVLHAFQKKSPSGNKTDARDVEAIEAGLKSAEEHYRETYEKKEDDK